MKRSLSLKALQILYHGNTLSEISDLSGKRIVGTFFKKVFQKTGQTEFRTEKVIKKKADGLYVIWKGYDNSFNGSIIG